MRGRRSESGAGSGCGTIRRNGVPDERVLAENGGKRNSGIKDPGLTASGEEVVEREGVKMLSLTRQRLRWIEREPGTMLFGLER